MSYIVIHLSPWSEKGRLLHITLHEDIKYYMSYIVIVNLPAQTTSLFHSRHVTGHEA